MKLRLGLSIAVVCGCSAITDFDPSKVGSGGSGGAGGMSGGGGSGGTGGTGGMSGTGGTGGTSGTGGMPDASVDAAIDGRPPMCVMNSDCNDGNFCTLNICNNGTCMFPRRDCNDNRSCTTDGCNPSFGCTHEPDNAVCADNIDCTVDTCDPNGPTPTGCVHTPNNSACDDGFACTDDVCDVQRDCLHIPNNALCNDGDPCTIDHCDPSGVGAGGDGCVHTPMPNCTPCMNNGDCPGTVCVPCTNGQVGSRNCMRRCQLPATGGTGVCVPDTQCNATCSPVCVPTP